MLVVCPQPFESHTYWLQHVLLVAVPIYLILCTRRYSSHQPLDLSWCLVSYGLWAIYHWCIVQAVSVWTLANIGNMLCAAISDPFYGSDYRLHGVWHQFVCTAIMGTLCGYIAKAGAAGRKALGSRAENKLKWRIWKVNTTERWKQFHKQLDIVNFEEINTCYSIVSCKKQLRFNL